MEQNEFIPGLELNEGFYHDVVKGILQEHYPDVNYSVALLGFGSDVLGVDTAISMDHMWGPRLYIFLGDEDYHSLKEDMDMTFKKTLPYTYKGFSINFSGSDHEGVRVMEAKDSGDVNHLIFICNVKTYFVDYIGSNDGASLSPVEWLYQRDQQYIEVISGRVYHDGLNCLNEIRKSFEFYPDEVLKFKLAVFWNAISQERAFVGRNRDLDSLLGVKLIADRLVNTMMKMCFYMERTYIPYSKWMYKMFDTLKCAKTMRPIFEEIVISNDPMIIEEGLCRCYGHLLQMQNQLKLTNPIEIEADNYHDRPYKVYDTEAIMEALIKELSDQNLKSLDLDEAGLLQVVDGLDFEDRGKIIKSVLKPVKSSL